MIKDKVESKSVAVVFVAGPPNNFLWECPPICNPCQALCVLTEPHWRIQFQSGQAEHISLSIPQQFLGLSAL